MPPRKVTKTKTFAGYLPFRYLRRQSTLLKLAAAGLAVDERSNAIPVGLDVAVAEKGAKGTM